MSNDIDALTSISTKFAQFVSENVHHMCAYLTEVVHIMVWASLYCQPTWQNVQRRLTKIVKNKEVAKKTSVSLKWYHKMEDKSLGKLQLVSVEKLKSNLSVTTFELSIEIMQQVFSDGLSDLDQDLTGMVFWGIFRCITMLPLIDLNPNDLTRTYSTQLHAMDLAFKMNTPTPQYHIWSSIMG